MNLVKSSKQSCCPWEQRIDHHLQRAGLDSRYEFIVINVMKFGNFLHSGEVPKESTGPHGRDMSRLCSPRVQAKGTSSTMCEQHGQSLTVKSSLHHTQAFTQETEGKISLARSVAFSFTYKDDPYHSAAPQSLYIFLCTTHAKRRIVRDIEDLALPHLREQYALVSPAMFPVLRSLLQERLHSTEYWDGYWTGLPYAELAFHKG